MEPQVLAHRPPSGLPGGVFKVARAALARQLTFPQTDPHLEHPPPLSHDDDDDLSAGPALKRQRSDASVQLQLMAQLHQALGKDSTTLSAPGTSTGIPTTAPAPAPTTLEALPDELLSMVLGFAAEGSDSPADFLSLLMVSKRFCGLGSHRDVLKRLPVAALKVSALSWSESAMCFLSRCAQAGNAKAAYALGMIAFYCLCRPAWGLRLLSQAALARHADALYSLAVIHFNGSGGAKEQRDVPAGVLLCMQAAALGHMDATRELGHCLQDGFGVQQDSAHGRQLLIRANAYEHAEALKWGADPAGAGAGGPVGALSGHGAPCCSGSGHATGTCGGTTSAGSTRTSGAVAPDSPVVPAGAQQQHSSERRTGELPLRRSRSAPPEVLSAVAQQGPTASALRQRFSGMQRHEPIQAPTPLHTAEAHWWTGAQNGVLTARGGVGGQVRGGRALSGQEAQTAGQQRGAHQCFCLPTVTLPLYALSNCGVRVFLLDWRFLEEAGLVEHSAPPVLVAGTPGVDLRGSRMACSNVQCGRVELRCNEFRCCSACTEARYCTRVCQAQDWKTGHKKVCGRMAQLHAIVDIDN